MRWILSTAKTPPIINFYSYFNVLAHISTGSRDILGYIKANTSSSACGGVTTFLGAVFLAGMNRAGVQNTLLAQTYISFVARDRDWDEEQALMAV